MIILAAFLVAGITASFGFQYQALLYMLAVIYAPATNEVHLMFITILYLPILLFSAFWRATHGNR